MVRVKEVRVLVVLSGDNAVVPWSHAVSKIAHNVGPRNKIQPDAGSSFPDLCIEAALQAPNEGCMVTEVCVPKREILNEAGRIFVGPQQHGSWCRRRYLRPAWRGKEDLSLEKQD